jgi:hypothetical protein
MDNAVIRQAELRGGGLPTAALSPSSETKPLVPPPSSTRAPPRGGARVEESGLFGSRMFVIGGILVLVAIVLFVVVPVVVSTSVSQSRESAPIPLAQFNGTVVYACSECLPGAPGLSIVGPTGATGPAGPQGRPGDKGDPGMCLASPTCASGATGPTGPTGATGPRGERGYSGVDGAIGPAGPSGPSGATGPSGPSGPIGPIGEPGVNGTCDCFDLQEVTINNTVLTGSLQVLGNVSCGTQTLFESSCFPNACVNFSSCDLQARRLILTGGSPTAWIVGSPNDPTGTVSATFGRSNTVNSTLPWLMQLFQSYAQTTIIESSIFTTIQTLTI